MLEVLGSNLNIMHIYYFGSNPNIMHIYYFACTRFVFVHTKMNLVCIDTY